MSNFEGDYMMRAVKPEFGNTNGKPKIRVEMEVAEGPLAGRRASYDGKLDEKNIKYTKQAMIALGWQGKDVRTFVDDVMRNAKPLPCKVRIASYTRDDGSVSQWSAVDRIGRSAKPLEAPSEHLVADVNSWFAEVPEEGGHPNAPGGGDDLPF